MPHCPHRLAALRTLVVAVVVLVASQFAWQVRDGDAVVSDTPTTGHFVADAFPIAEAGVVAR